MEPGKLSLYMFLLFSKKLMREEDPAQMEDLAEGYHHDEHECEAHVQEKHVVREGLHAVDAGEGGQGGEVLASQRQVEVMAAESHQVAGDDDRGQQSEGEVVGRAGDFADSRQRQPTDEEEHKDEEDHDPGGAAGHGRHGLDVLFAHAERSENGVDVGEHA